MRLLYMFNLLNNTIMKIKKYFLEKSKIGLLLMSFWCMSSLTTQAQDHVYEGGISVSTQAAVDALGASGGALAGDITKIMGNVTISGSVTDLSIFNDIDTITGYLQLEQSTQLTALNDFINLKVIGEYFIVGSVSTPTNSRLDNIGSFPHLDSIGGYFEIRNNTSLDTIGSFPVLRSIGGYFRVGDNNQLITVGSFQSLETVGGNLNFDDNPKITMIGEYPRLRSIGDQFRVVNCEQLQSLNGFPSLTHVGATFFVYRNDSLKIVENFSVLTTIGGNLQIDQNDVLRSIGDFPVLSSVGTDLRIALNPLLDSIGDFPSLTTVENNVPITANPLLRSIGDFPVLTTIGGNLQIDQNNVLRSIGDFPVLTTIGGNLQIDQNNVLRSIGDFPVLTTIEGDLQIQNNDSLSFCCGLSRVLLNESTTVSGNTTISGNALGCNDKEEINCDISFQPLIDTLMLSFQSTTTTFILHSQTRWRLSREEGTEANWLTGLSLDGGSTSVTDDLMGEGTASITVTYAQNGNTEFRMARLLISFLDESGNVLDSPVPYTLTLIQEEVMPTLQLPPDTVNVSHLSGSTNITLSANNVKWRLRKPDTGADWITMLSVGTTSHTDTLMVTNNSFVPTDTVVTITYEELPISLTNRSAVFVLEAIDDDGGVLDDLSPITITLTQATAPYMGNITLTTQAEVNTIRDTLGNSRTTAIMGNLIIGPSSDITNLDSLYFLTKITGNLEIRNDSMLEDVGDFPMLSSIGGNFFMHTNTILRNAGNFPMLSGIGGYFLIRASDSLTSVGSFPRLATIGGYFAVRGTKILRVLYEFPALTSIGMRDGVWVPSLGATRNGVSIVVEQNPLLFYCCGLSRFFSGRSNAASGDVYIGSDDSRYENSTSCNSEEEISCDISSRLTSDTFMLPFYTTDTTFIFHSPTRWRLSQEGTAADWITGLSLDGGSTNVTNNLMGDRTASITVTYAQNGTAESRTVRLLISFLDAMGNELTSPMPDTLTLIQEEVMPTLQLSPNAVSVSHFSGSTAITLSANNVKWRLRKDSGADWITMLSVGTTSHTDTLTVTNNSFFSTDTVVTITYEELPISLTDRSALLVLEAIDDEANMLENISPITITLTQAIPPYLGDVILINQAQVDNIRNTLNDPRITAIGGNLTIGPSRDITRLDSLYFLTEIVGNFQVKGNFMLKNLGDFPALESIGENFQVTGNLGLDSLGNYGVLRHIGGDFQIGHASPIIGGGYNLSLVYLGDFSSLTSIAGNYYVGYNFALETGGNFPMLEQIGGDYSIDNNPILVSGGVFPVLDSIGGDYYVYNNKLLVGLGTFSSLAYIGEDYHIDNNNSLFAESDFRSLKNIVGNYILTSNDILLTGGDFSALDSIGGYYYLYDNPFLLTGGDFSSLERVGGYYSVFSNDKLIDLGDFSSLERVDGYYSIGTNAGLLTVDEFSSLEYIGGDYSIRNNDNLLTIDGFSSLEYIRGNYSTHDNDILLTVGEFPSLDSVGGYYSIMNNDNLLTGGDFSSLEQIGSYFSIRENSKLENVGSFSSLVDIRGYFSITSNDSLRYLYDFPALMTIRGGGAYVPSVVESRANAKVVVEDNSLLEYCCVLMGNIDLSLPSDSVYVNNNALGCDSVNDVSCNAFVEVLQADDALKLPFYTTNTTFTIVSNTRWQLSKPNAGADWVTMLSAGEESHSDSIMGGQNEELTYVSVSVDQQQNSVDESRSVNLFISFLDTMDVATVVDTLTIIQKGMSNLLVLEPSGLLNVSHSAGSTEISIRSNVRWQLRKPSGVTWITGLSDGTTSNADTLKVDKSNVDASEVTTVTITYENAPTSVDRTAMLTLVSVDENGNAPTTLPLLDTITIIQSGFPSHIGDIVLTTQAQVNNIRAKLGGNPRITAIVGDLIIGPSSDITDLSPLNFLTEVTGNFIIGRFSDGNSSLVNIGEFPFLQKIGGNYLINENDELLSGGDFPVLNSIGGYYSIRDNVNLLTGGDFSSLEQIGDYFSVHNNRGLKFLGNFSGLEKVSTIFNISSNPVLRSLGDFSSLDSIGGGLVVIANNELLDLGDFSSLDSIGIQDRVYVPSSESSDDDGLIDGASIVIENNPELFLCCGLQNLLPSGADSVAGDVYISNNGEGCNYANDLSSDQLALNFGGLGDCSTLVLRSQTEVDGFSMTEISGNLVIGSSSGSDGIENLNGLNSLTQIAGRLLIKENKDLSSLVGLSGLSKIGDNFYIQDNTSLSSLRGLTTLDSIGGSFRVRSNPSLLTLSSFPELDNIGGSYIIQGNTSLRSLGYSPLQTIDSIYYVVNNPLLSSLGDYPMLSSIGVSENSTLVPSTMTDTTNGYQTGVSIVVEDNDSLSNCCVLSGFLSDSSNAVNGAIYLNNNKAACNDTTTISACVELLEVAASELISGNSTFTSIGVLSTTKWLLIKPSTGAEWINLKDGASNALDTIRGERDSTFMIFHSAYTGDEIREAILRLEAVDDGGMTLTDPPSVTIALRQDFIKTLSVTGSKDRRLTIVSGSEVIAITSNTDWRAEVLGAFIDSLRFIPTGGGTVISVLPVEGRITLTGSGAGELSVFYQENTNLYERNSTLRLSVYEGDIKLTDPAPIEIMLTQAEAPPSLMLTSSSSVEIASTSTTPITITFDVGGATGWSASLGDASFITLSKGNRDVGTGITITATPEINTGAERMATITLSTIGGTGTAVMATVTITQAAGPPTFMLTSDNNISIGNTATTSTDSTVIEFTVGGGAMGWSATLSENSFLMLSKMSGLVGMTTIKVASTANTGAERMATITLTTMGGTGTAVTATVMITQAAGSPSLMLTSPSSVEITSTSTTPITITFDVGGGATGWSASAGTGSFITLSKGNGEVGTGIIITATPTENTGAERTATITLTTMGGTGTAVTATVTITQAASTALGVSVSKPFTLYPNPTTGKLTIEGISGYLQIYLHDFAGKEVFASSLTSSRNTIDLSHLPSGMYVITLQGEDKTMTEVLIIVN